MKVYLAPAFNQVNRATGIGRVVYAQYQYLPQFGVELVNDIRVADVTAVHTHSFDVPNPDVVMIHGLYWTGDPGSGQYNSWNSSINGRLIDAMRKARAITVPSEWVSVPIKRDMRVQPEVIGHGIDFVEWRPGQDAGYLLWNKNRSGDVCDPTPPWKLAQSGIRVLSTFAPLDEIMPENMMVTGRLPAHEMKVVIENAHMYLATTKETFGIGTLEAMACGVPVLGYDWGGTSDLVCHKVTGWLARPGDIAGLIEGYDYIHTHRAEMSENARAVAATYTWPTMIQKYAALFERMLVPEPTGVAVIVTNYNYGEYLGKAVGSLLNQTYIPDEIIVVDDGSTDNSREILERFSDEPRVKVLYQQNQGVAAARNHGIAATTQPLCVFLDADDYLDSRMIAACRDALLADHGLGIAYTGLQMLHGDGSKTLSSWPPPFDWKGQTTVSNPPSNCIPAACMFRRSMWVRAGGERQQYAPAEDCEFWTRGLSTGFTAKKVTDEGLFIYRVHGGSASRSKQYHEIDAWLPWMRDRQYPLGAPCKNAPLIRSYSEPDISVIIPVGKGHEKIVTRALDCLVGQTFRNWEAVVVNDTGSDLDLPACYMWVREIRTDGEAGAGFARNAGLKAAKGLLVCFLDADDWFQPTALQEMLDYFTDTQGRFVYTDWQTMDGTKVEAPDFQADDYWQSLPHSVTTLMAREDVVGIGGFDEQLEAWEDWDFYLRAVLSGMVGVRLPRSLFVYDSGSGMRRKVAQRTEKSLRRKILAKYKGVEMSPCCGGGPAAANILNAKRNLPPMGSYAEAVNVAEIPTTDQGKIRLQYTGNRQGSVSYMGQRLTYRFGNNTMDRVHDVEPEDVERLLGAGDFKVVPINAPTGPAGFVPAPASQNVPKEPEPLAGIKVKPEEKDPNAAMLELEKSVQDDLDKMEDTPIVTNEPETVAPVQPAKKVRKAKAGK